MAGPRFALACAPPSRAPMLVVLALALSALAGPASADPPAGRYDNTYQKDFIMDAPWRVKDANTAIPIVIVLKDCDTNDVRQLHWIRAWDVTSGQVLLWDHNFGDERIGDDPYEANFWMYVTTVTEGHPTLPNGTPLTPARLGHGPGDAIQIKVSIYYKDDVFNYTETRYLRVRVAHDGTPWPAGWYGGDTHYHTMYTNNTAECGVPLPAVVLAGSAMGLDWLTTTDHSCDLDETGDGSYSYATTHWEYTIEDETGTQTFYRNNQAIGSTWDVLGAEIALWSSSSFRLARAVELNVASVDGDTYQKTLHSLVYSNAYIASPLSGALGERPVTPSLPAGLAQVTGGGFVFAAHPLSDLSAEWGGLDWAVNGTLWGGEDIATALGYEQFLGLEAFNTRATRTSTDVANPWPDFDAGEEPANPYPQELLAGIALWDQQLRAHMNPARKIFLSGGSDAHGDLNYGSFIALNNYATDDAIGKVQTVVFVPGGGYGRENLPPMSDILSAWRAGRSVVTDGPFVEIGADRNGDGDFTDDGDLLTGDDATVGPAQSLPLTVRWQSTGDSGPVVALCLYAGSAAGTSPILSLNPNGSGHGWSGEATLDANSLGLEGSFYLRAECRTDLGGESFRAYTNPIWVRFDPTSIAGGDEPVARLFLALRRNPFPGAAELVYGLPSDGHRTLAVYDVSGRLVAVLADGSAASGAHTLAWDATDARGRPVAAGVYLFKLTQDGETAVRKGVVLR
jgi:hypothetical protein